MKKVLIIEDEPDMAKVLAKRLSANDYSVMIALDAIQGLAEAHHLPDIIILDLLLPAGGGLSVLQRLRESMNTKHIPVIVLTGNQDSEMERRVVETGIQGYIVKPYDFDALLGEVMRLVGQ